uniref:Uncharacterized protein n=1 Tax=Vitiosangium cumulatum TaxID=1867796 RepID=A0A7D5CGR0_9BACT|nr:hypothetical protein [Vitiosangium cumulatum]
MNPWNPRSAPAQPSTRELECLHLQGRMENPRENRPDALAILLRARELVRSRWRSADYYKAGDRFSDMFLGRTFQLEPDYYKAVGTDYSAIDCLYEELGSGGVKAIAELGDVTRRLQDMTDPTSASRALKELQTALQNPSCPLLDVCRALLAAITVLGHERMLARGSSALARDWLKLWQDYLWQQNSQQARLNRLCLVVSATSKEDRAQMLAALGTERDHLSVASTSFAAGMCEYLDKYSETGASAVALIGGLPFAQALSTEGLEEMLRLLSGDSGFLGRMASLLRLAQDIRFDPTEPINTGVMGYAAEHHLSLLDVDARQLPRAEIDEKLKREWETWFAACRQHFDALMVPLKNETLKPALQAFVVNLCSIASRLAAVGHESRTGT